MMKVLLLFFVFSWIRGSNQQIQEVGIAYSNFSLNLALKIYVEPKYKSLEEAKAVCKNIAGYKFHMAYELHSPKVLKIALDLIRENVNTSKCYRGKMIS